MRDDGNKLGGLSVWEVCKPQDERATHGEDSAPGPRTATDSHQDRPPDHRLAARHREELEAAGGDAAAPIEPLAVALRRLLGRSLRLRQVSAGGCNGCEAELVALGNVVFDLSRFGIQFVASPRHADGVVVTGPVTRNMASALGETYAATPRPKIVLAVGACALSGGLFSAGPTDLAGVPSDLPVDLFVPGCPPHPLTMIHGLLRLLGRL
jgi:Ni,Fe-hydrogenase III small subunit